MAANPISRQSPAEIATFDLNGVTYPLAPYVAPDRSVWHFTHGSEDGRAMPVALAEGGDRVTLAEMVHGHAYRYLRPAA
jgi:hypothetical protein